MWRRCAPNLRLGSEFRRLWAGISNRRWIRSTSAEARHRCSRRISWNDCLVRSATVSRSRPRLRASGIGNINLDLIAGLPHQTEQSWSFSLGEALATGIPHISVYMLEVDEESRLGNELLAGGGRYHAHFVPDDDLTADLYLAACARLERGGVRQYEISNFARPVNHGIGLHDSRHNLKYWTRQPYLGFGV